MELDEMKTLWASMSVELDKQKKLTDKIILEMTQEKYKNRLQKISIPEKLSAILCYIVLVLILANFKKLDTWYLLAAGLASMLILAVLPLLSLKAIKKMNSINIARNNFKETFASYTKGKQLFYKISKLGIFLGMALMFMIIPVFLKIFKDRNIIEESNKYLGSPLFLSSLVIAVIFFVFFTQWVSKHYSKTITDAENILKELE
ncbi:hypothetical protein [Abyssalbus ytuae]|uniref:Uncharacterized protein n=1 Tax=Abyssalbus ytuae TaxID=2926907 RepID=A0A9E6ZMG7_9FLAO|nr:hypothetical protein [Abyssalbus ytuae]UOB17015.1 hypothetical protein MQE35_14905 [Abyssalbus ytuae]